MRCLLLAFALGVIALQQQPLLPGQVLTVFALVAIRSIACVAAATRCVRMCSFMATVHPRPEIVERYDVAGGRSFRTDYDGALTFDFDRGTRRAPQAPREHEARYWREARVRGELPPLE